MLISTVSDEKNKYIIINLLIFFYKEMCKNRTSCTFLFDNRQGLSCDERLVTGTLTVDNSPIHRYFCARNHLKSVSTNIRLHKSNSRRSLSVGQDNESMIFYFVLRLSQLSKLCFTTHCHCFSDCNFLNFSSSVSSETQVSEQY